ncbi:glycosyl transferase family 2 [Azorhizobium oxalatiphilum]|uniref:Beta-monoglucosyldiacylglycerol synthase n=2 Tax=Azorhizobium oxalatiphilum TaxID=980631 RepID=A0A917FII1_9HYPH|nr:glycosyl transferase family 2 [Azorhizobium oxalatiphilum]
MKTEVNAPAVTDRFSSLSFAPYGRGADPDAGEATNEAQIRADVDAVAPYTRSIRTYSATGGVELTPPIAAARGLKVSVGAWIDKNEDRNARELRNAIDLTHKNSNVEGLVVGNETIFRGEKSAAEMADLIRKVKRQTNVPVTTGEIWNVWLDHPELVSAVDYIAAHILPYWEGVPAEQVVDRSIDIYNRLRAAYPGKRIVIAEFGWPSAGYNRDASVPGELKQAQVIRTFAARAEALGIEYNIIEAFDAPWKSFEGSVGQYWGIMDAQRHLKFPLTGPLVEQTYGRTAILALLLGVLFSLPMLRAPVTVQQGLALSAAANGAGAWVALVINYWLTHYVTGGNYITVTLSLLLLGPLVLCVLYRAEELTAVAFGRRPKRLVENQMLDSQRSAHSGRFPKVSIHIPAYREPPEMLKQTIDSVARLNYPNFEAVIIVNNTPDPAMVEPVRAHCETLGAHIKFINAEKVAGFKAGALRIALEHTADDAEIIGIIDADYVVHADWLKDLVPSFDDPTVGLVQAPQDHRDGAVSPLHEAMNAEYAGFFDIGMVQRNEEDAIVVHGTMCLIRRAAMMEAGSWSSDTICEDTDLGLTIAENGWKTHYTRKRYGWGLLPDTFEAFKKQRHRWAYGGFQIIKKHWRRFLPGNSRLTTAQRRHFVLGWVTWLGAESVGAVAAALSLIFVPFVFALGIAVPAHVLTLPIIATFLVYVLHFIAMYRLRVATTPLRMLGAAFAAMAVQFTVAKAVYDGFRYKDLAFARTAKGGNWLAGAARSFPALWETVIGGLLFTAGVAVHMQNWHAIREVDLYALALVIQSLPFLAASLIGLAEGSKFNDFAVWRAARAKLGLRTLRAPVVE